MLFFQAIFCLKELKWIEIFNSFQSIFVCWDRYTEDISQDILEMFWVYQIWSLYSQ